jgi:hypothetical protein
MIREIEFSTRLAYDLWIRQRGEDVSIVFQSDLWEGFGYDTSKRLPEPKIIVRYVDFTED